MSVILGIALGMILSTNQLMFYNLLLMPLIGGVSYFCFKKKALYTCIAVFVVGYLRWLYDSFGYALNGSFTQAFIPPLFWAVIYLSLTLLGIFIAGLLHFGLRKE